MVVIVAIIAVCWTVVSVKNRVNEEEEETGKWENDKEKK